MLQCIKVKLYYINIIICIKDIVGKRIEKMNNKIFLLPLATLIILIHSPSYAYDNISWSTCLTHPTATQTGFQAEALALDADGNIAATGRYRDGLAFVLIDTASGDTLIPPVFYGVHSSASTGHDIFSPGPNAYIIAGFRSHETTSTRLDLWVLKMDQDGDTAWTRIFSPPWNMSRISTSSIGGDEFFVSATWLDWTAGDPGYVLQIIKMNVSGDSLWMRAIDTSNDGAINAMHLRSEGDVLCAGKTGGAILVCAIDTAATVVWQKTYSFSGNDMATDITELSNGNIVVAGESMRDPLSPTTSAFDSWVLLLNSAGDSINSWRRSFSEDGSYSALAVAPCSSYNGFFVAGKGTDDLNRPQWWVAYFDSTGDTVHTYLSSGGGIHDAISVGGGEFALAVATDYSFCVFRIGTYCTSITPILQGKRIRTWNQCNGNCIKPAQFLYQVNGRILPERSHAHHKVMQWLINPENRKIYLTP